MRCVLIVEDDADTREVCRLLLQREGFHVLEAADGVEGLKSLKEHVPVHLVILDMAMPVMGGDGFLEEKSKDPVVAPIPVLVLTALSGIKVDGRGQPVAFFQKPVDPQRLLGVIRTLSGKDQEV